MDKYKICDILLSVILIIVLLAVIYEAIILFRLFMYQKKSSNKHKPKIFIIGSVSQEDEIHQYAERMIRKYGRKNVKYIKRQPDIQFSTLIHRCYENIDWATIVYVWKKHDGTIGTGTRYEVEYAKHRKKIVIFLDPNTSCCNDYEDYSLKKCPICGYKIDRPYHFIYESGYNKRMILARPHYRCVFCHKDFEGSPIVLRDQHGKDALQNIKLVRNAYEPLSDLNVRLDIYVPSSYKKDILIIRDKFDDIKELNRILMNQYVRPYFINILDNTNDQYCDIDNTYRLIRKCDKIIMFYYDNLINNINIQYIRSYAAKYNKPIIEVPSNPLSNISRWCPKCNHYDELAPSISYKRIIDKPGVSISDKIKKRYDVYVVPRYRCTNPDCGYVWYGWDKSFPVTDENGDDCSEILEYFITHR